MKLDLELCLHLVVRVSLCLHRVIIPFKVIGVVSMCINWYSFVFIHDINTMYSMLIAYKELHW